MTPQAKKGIDFLAWFIGVMTVVIFIASLVAISLVGCGCSTNCDPKGVVGGLYCRRLLEHDRDAGPRPEVAPRR